LFSAELAGRDAVLVPPEFATDGLGAGATVVRVGDDDVLVRQVALSLLYHFVQS
jgi:hypothetical protein